MRLTLKDVLLFAVTLGWKQPKPQEPSHLETLAGELQEAKVDLLREAKLREYHVSMEAMLITRINRLEDAIQSELNQPKEFFHATSGQSHSTS